MEGKGYIIAQAWRIARPYWFSEERWVARGLLAAVLAMNLAQVWINVRLNFWRNAFYDTLQRYNETQFFYQLGLFALTPAPTSCCWSMAPICSRCCRSAGGAG